MIKQLLIYFTLNNAAVKNYTLHRAMLLEKFALRSFKKFFQLSY